MATYQLPIEKFLVTKIQEHFPNFDIRQGTAFRDMLIKPMIILMQPYRDQVNIIKRNLSLQNFEMMSEEEMDALVANVFVERRGGTKSEGTVRVYFAQAVQVTFSTTVQFQTTDGLIFYPKNSISFVAEEVALNTEGLYYFVNIPSIAESEGLQYNIDPHAILFVAGGPDGVVKVDNPSSFALGVDRETNAQLKDRTEKAISVRDLVIKKSISAVLLENFDSLREISVAGFGDPEMNRDVMTTVLDLVSLVDERVTGRADGTTTFIDTAYPPDIDFYAIGLQPGNRLVILSGPNTGLYPIKAVTGAQSIEVTTNITTEDNVDYGLDGLVTTDQYHIGGKVDVYVDSTKLAEAQVVITPCTITNKLLETNPGNYANNIAFVLPVVGMKAIYEADPATLQPLEPIYNSTLWEYFVPVPDGREGYTQSASAGFTSFFDSSSPDMDFIVTGILPGFYLVITEGPYAGRYMIQDVPPRGSPYPNNELIVYGTIPILTNLKYHIEATDYVFESHDPKTRLSVREQVQVRLLQTDPVKPRYYVGSTLDVLYFMDRSVHEVQDFIGEDPNRVVTADMLCRRCIPTFIDFDVVYTGDVDETTLVNVLSTYIDDLTIGSQLQISDMISVAYFFNVNFVNPNIEVHGETRNLDGTTTRQTSNVAITVPRTSKLIPRNIAAAKLIQV